MKIRGPNLVDSPPNHEPSSTSITVGGSVASPASVAESPAVCWRKIVITNGPSENDA